MAAALFWIGLALAAGTLAVLLWSIVVPDRRIRPPRRYTAVTPVAVWVPTVALFGILFVLGVLGWNEAGLPAWLRCGIGLPLVVAGNLAVWYEAGKFGFRQTSGDSGTLRTEGLYRYSRNPQYVADIGMIAGWLILSASAAAAWVGGVAILALAAAPFAEEPWLRQRYGNAFETYAGRVRRFF